jgi:flagellar biosynthetic protein FlhB
MAEEGAGEKTEEPTAKKLEHSRGEGMVPKSVELSQLTSMVTAVYMLQIVAPSLWEKLQVVFRWGFTSPMGGTHWSIAELRFQFINLLYFLLPDLMILLGTVAFVGALTTLLQTNFLWSNKLLVPKFSKLNPVMGLQRLISAQNFVQVLKSIAKLAFIGPIAYFSMMGIFPEFFSLMDLPLRSLLPYTASAAGRIFENIAYFLLVLSIIDYAWQRYSVGKKLKMSKQEVEDERKSTEGDEKTKMKIRQKALQKARQRMMQAVKTADVVVTNPTHYAVALNYTDSPGGAPIVVAKGVDHLAARIREVARAHGVPVMERKLLARTLYANVEVGREIPYELYSAVAEVLAYVFKLKGKNPLKKRKPSEESRV